MKVEYINPFIESVVELFTYTLGSGVKRGEVGVHWEIPDTSDIVALVGMRGRARGTIAISFPVSTALAIAGKMLGESVMVVDEIVKDKIEELVQIFVGSAKGKFLNYKDKDMVVELSQPTVVRGTDEQVNFQTRTAWLEVPFESELGPFSLRVTFETLNENGVDES